MQEPRVAKEAYIESMRSELEGLLGEVMEAVNAAPGGRVIADSEEQVRQLMHEFRRRAYERRGGTGSLLPVGLKINDHPFEYQRFSVLMKTLATSCQCHPAAELRSIPQQQSFCPRGLLNSDTGKIWCARGGTE